MLNFFIDSMIPVSIVVIILFGIKEKKDVFKLFIEGVLDGLKVVYNIFPYILAITMAIGLLKNTGAIDFLISPIKGVLEKLNVPSEILPLCILRPISGGASMSAVMDIFKEHRTRQ